MMMKQKVDQLEKIINKYDEEVKKYGCELFYDFFTGSTVSTELMIGPIETSGIEGLIAEKIAKKYDVKLRRYDFSRGKWSEARDYRTVFSVPVPDNESDFESIVKKLCGARKEFSEALEKLVENVA